MEYLRKELGDAAARFRLSQDASAIRAQLTLEEPLPFDERVELRSKGPRQRAYEAGNIACQKYVVGALPPETMLRSDLEIVLQLYGRAVAAKNHLLLHSPGVIASPNSEESVAPADPLQGFRPKDDAEYRATLVGRQLIKTRRHEKLVNDYAKWCGSSGWRVSTEHPQDLVLYADDMAYIVEAKIVYKGNATDAVRASVGQLLAYAYLLHPADGRPGLLALFSEDVGQRYVDFLRSLDIHAVWWAAGSWCGNHTAVRLGLASL
jgi:hypothetical protein